MTTLLVACGALAREVLALEKEHDWDAQVLALPALLHNRPERIPGAVEERVETAEEEYDRIVVVYGDCGTGGTLDQLLDERGWERVNGPHCYSFYAGEKTFQEMMEEEPGTFFLTDYLAQSFDHLVLEGLGLDRHPELAEDYFGNYTRMVYLQQRQSDELLGKARQASKALGLPLEVRHTGLTGLQRELIALLEPTSEAEEKARTKPSAAAA